MLCTLVSRTERAQTQHQRLAKQLLGLHVLAALRERVRQVGRRDQRMLVLCAEQAGLLNENLTFDLHGLGVLALPRERGR